MPALPALVTQGWNVVVDIDATIPAPPEIVWSLLTDWERQGDWMLEASDFVVTSAHREGLGVEAEATVKIAGIETRDRVVVVGWQPTERLTIDHMGWVGGTGDLFLAPSGPGRCHLFWREELHPPLGILGALGMTALKPLMKRVFRRDLRALAALAARDAGLQETGTPRRIP